MSPDRRWRPQLFALALLMAVACGDKGADSASGEQGLPDDPDTSCNEANQDCGADTCSGSGPTMLPGADCVACHRDGGLGDGESPSALWPIGGTVFYDADGHEPADGARVTIIDATGERIELVANAVGNFYSPVEPVWPVTAEVETTWGTLSMRDPVDYGGCNACHRCGGSAGGKLMARH